MSCFPSSKWTFVYCLAYTFSPSRKLNRKASGNETGMAWVQPGEGVWKWIYSVHVKGVKCSQAVSSSLEMDLPKQKDWIIPVSSPCPLHLESFPDSQVLLSMQTSPLCVWHPLSSICSYHQKAPARLTAWLAWKAFCLLEFPFPHRPACFRFGLFCRLIYWCSDLALEASGNLKNTSAWFPLSFWFSMNFWGAIQALFILFFFFFNF